MRREYETVLAACQLNLQAIDGLIFHDESYLALEQLDQRRSGGEALSCIDEAGLRAQLAGDVARRRRALAQISGQMKEALSRLKALYEPAPLAQPGPGEAAGETPADALSLIDALARAISEEHVPAFLETHSDPTDAGEARPAAAPGADGETAFPAGLEPAGRDGVAETPDETHEPNGAAGDDLTRDDLTRISGIDTVTAGVLSEAGVHSYARIAAWKRDDIQSLASARDIPPSRVAAQGWIEQAAVLAEGRTTRFAARKARGEMQVAKTARAAGVGHARAAVTPDTARVRAARETGPSPEPTGQTGATSGRANAAPEDLATVSRPAPAASMSTTAPRASRLKRGLRHAVATTAAAILAFALMTAVEFAPDKLGTMAQMINPSVWAAVSPELR